MRNLSITLSNSCPCSISFGPGPLWTRNVSRNSLLAARAMAEFLAVGVFATSDAIKPRVVRTLDADVPVPASDDFEKMKFFTPADGFYHIGRQSAIGQADGAIGRTVTGRTARSDGRTGRTARRTDEQVGRPGRTATSHGQGGRPRRTAMSHVS